MLAGTIGERNVWRYDGLQRAAEYIEGEFTRYGYEPRRQTYEVSRVPVSNIESTLTGTSHPPRSSCSAPTTTRCRDVPVRTTTAPVSRRCSNSRAGSPASPGADDPLRRLRQRGAAVLPHRRMGSVVYARAARARGDNIVAMMALETMGYYSTEKGSQTIPTADRDDVPGRRELHWLCRQPRVGADDDAGAQGVQGTHPVSAPVRGRAGQHPRCWMVGPVGLLGSRLSRE